MPIQSPDVYVKDTGTAKGRGTYAARRFKAGETVEESPVILFEGSLEGLPIDVQRIVFNWSYLVDRSMGCHAFALGYGSMYNHANPANLRYSANTTSGRLVFAAARAIEADEELTINYNASAGEPESQEDSWFEMFEVEPIN